MIAVVNTGPLVYLAQLDRLNLLQDLYEPCAPLAVLDEISVWSSETRHLVQSAAADWLKVLPVNNTSLCNHLLPQIDLGEAQVIALAVELGAQRVLLDDQDARRHARLYGLQPIGTLGLLLEAKQHGLLGAIQPEIERLARTNFYFSSVLVERILQAAGEKKRAS